MRYKAEVNINNMVMKIDGHSLDDDSSMDLCSKTGSEYKERKYMSELEYYLKHNYEDLKSKPVDNIIAGIRVEVASYWLKDNPLTVHEIELCDGVYIGYNTIGKFDNNSEIYVRFKTSDASYYCYPFNNISEFWKLLENIQEDIILGRVN